MHGCDILTACPLPGDSGRARIKVTERPQVRLLFWSLRSRTSPPYLSSNIIQPFECKRRTSKPCSSELYLKSSQRNMHALKLLLLFIGLVMANPMPVDLEIDNPALVSMLCPTSPHLSTRLGMKKTQVQDVKTQS